MRGILLLQTFLTIVLGLAIVFYLHTIDQRLYSASAEQTVLVQLLQQNEKANVALLSIVAKLDKLTEKRTGASAEHSSDPSE